MNYLLDTCVLSEFTRRLPSEKVIGWMSQVDEERLYLSAITVGKIQRGVEQLPESQRNTELRVWVNTGLVERFGARILPLDTDTMILWGSLTARLEASGQPRPVMDTLIAACALRNNLIIATRNLADYRLCGVQLINPWE